MPTRLVIGPSTGWLYAKEIFSLSQQEAVLKESGANAVEICLASWDCSDKRALSLKARESFNVQTFGYHSLHLADVTGEESEQQLVMVKEAIANHSVDAAVTHPLKVRGEYPVESYERMISAGIPLTIENMDKRKDSGFNPVELEELVTALGCGFVLDVQHAYEHDHGMKYAGNLLESLKARLAHLHVSGETEGNIHSLVHKATNAKTIVEFVGRVLATKDVPIVLEGEYTTSEELRQEIEFLNKELGSR